MSTTSPSQCVTVEGCNRRWWFESVVRLRLPDSKPQHLGHALHLVNAAHLRAEELPPTWADALTNEEVDVCLELRDRAIRQGVLRARMGLLIEHDFRMEIKTDEMHGVIDVADPQGIVEDHKLVAAAKWAKTEADLWEDIPMMIYGGWLLQQHPALESVTLRHNQFIRETMRVQAVEVTPTRGQVKQFWARRVMPLLVTMDKNRTVEQWADVPGQPRLSPACTKYGGCPFANICHNGLPMEEFEGGSATKEGAPF